MDEYKICSLSSLYLLSLANSPRTRTRYPFYPHHRPFIFFLTFSSDHAGEDAPEDEEISAERYSVGFLVDVQSLQAELDRLRRVGAGVSVGGMSGSGSGNSPSTSVRTGTSPSGRSSRSASGEGNPAPAVTVLHLVMKAAASAVLEVFPHSSLSCAHGEGGEEEELVSPNTALLGRDDGAGRGRGRRDAMTERSRSGSRGRRGRSRATTRIACRTARTTSAAGNNINRGGGIATTNNNNNSGNNNIAMIALVVVEGAEGKSAGDIAIEVSAGAAAAADGGGDWDRRTTRVHGGAVSRSVPLLHAGDMGGIGRASGRGRGGRGGETGRGRGRSSGTLPSSSWYWSASGISIIEQQEQQLQGVPLLHREDVATLVGMMSSPGRGQQRRKRADCLVEIRSTNTGGGGGGAGGTGSSSSSSSSAAVATASTAAHTTTATANDRPGSVDSRHASRQGGGVDHVRSLQVTMVPRPEGEGAGAPLRITVGRVSAVVGGGGGALGGGGAGAPPVIVLEVSVVGAGKVGAGGTGAFAEALRRRLLRVEGGGGGGGTLA